MNMSSHVVAESPQHLHDHDSGAFVSHGSNSWPHAVTSHSLTWLEREAMPCYDSVLWGENSGTARLASRRVHCRRRNTKGVQGTRGDARRSEYHDTCWQYSSAQTQYEDDSHRPEPFVFFLAGSTSVLGGGCLSWEEGRGFSTFFFSSSLLLCKNYTHCWSSACFLLVLNFIDHLTLSHLRTSLMTSA